MVSRKRVKGDQLGFQLPAPSSQLPAPSSQLLTPRIVPLAPEAVEEGALSGRGIGPLRAAAAFSSAAIAAHHPEDRAAEDDNEEEPDEPLRAVVGQLRVGGHRPDHDAGGDQAKPDQQRSYESTVFEHDSNPICARARSKGSMLRRPES